MSTCIGILIIVALFALCFLSEIFGWFQDKPDEKKNYFTAEPAGQAPESENIQENTCKHVSVRESIESIPVGNGFFEETEVMICEECSEIVHVGKRAGPLWMYGN